MRNSDTRNQSTGEPLTMVAPMIPVGDPADAIKCCTPDRSRRLLFNTLDMAIRHAVEWQANTGLPATVRYCDEPRDAAVEEMLSATRRLPVPAWDKPELVPGMLAGWRLWATNREWNMETWHLDLVDLAENTRPLSLVGITWAAEPVLIPVEGDEMNSIRRRADRTAGR